MKTGFAHVLLLLILVCWGHPEFFSRQQAHAQTAPVPPPVVVAFGDSLTLGTGSTANNNYVDVLARRTTLAIINKGVSGDTTATARVRLQTDVLSYDPDIVIVFLGGNDVLNNVPLDTTIANLRSIVTDITAKGGRVILVGAHASVFDQTRDIRFDQLANELKVRYVSNALRGILGNPKLLADAVHPNNAGYAILADRMWPQIQKELNLISPTPTLRLMCEVTPETAQSGTTVEWRAYAWGGEKTDYYQYQWSGDNLSSFGEYVTARYENEGVKRASVTATSGTQTLTVPCRNSVTVTVPPLVGVCEVRLGIQLAGDNDRNEVYADWRAEARGARGDYMFSWDGTDGLSGREQTVRHRYVQTGIKKGTVTITSGGRSLELPCSIQVRRSMFTATTTTPLHGGCSVAPGNYSTDQSVHWSAYASGGVSGSSTTFLWSDSSSLDGETDQSVNVEYSTPGTKDGTVTVTRGEDSFDAECTVALSAEPVTGGGSSPGCFIATAAYGHEMEPQVALLRKFRDEHLLTHRLGRAFVAAYYRLSPPLANRIREHELAKTLIRTLLAPLVLLVDLVVE